MIVGRIGKSSSSLITSSARVLRTPFSAAPSSFLLTHNNQFVRTAATASNMKTIIDTIKTDHRAIEEYGQNVMNATDDDTRARWQNQFVWEVARHSIAEELVVYPAIQKHLPDGKSRADKDRAEHQVVKNKLADFQKMKPNHPDLIPTLQSMMADLRQHMDEEEQDDLVALEAAIPTEDSHKMAKSFDRTKMFVPSRSHPSAPDKPPFETVVGLLTAPIDHIMDLFRKFPEDVSPNPSMK